MRFKHISGDKELKPEPEVVVNWKYVRDAMSISEDKILSWVEEGVKQLMTTGGNYWYCESGDTLVFMTVDEENSIEVRVTKRQRTAFINTRGE